LILESIVQTFVGMSVSQFGLSDTSPLYTRLTYHFFHANILHAFLNVSCLLSVVFYYNVSVWNILWAFFVASTFPFATSIPAIGMSGVCYALIGELLPVVQRKMYFNNIVLATIAFGFLFSNCAALLHLYCYAVSATIGLLSWKR
jgi:membrane associated rhomboid family serine protease